MTRDHPVEWYRNGNRLTTACLVLALFGIGVLIASAFGLIGGDEFSPMTGYGRPFNIVNRATGDEPTLHVGDTLIVEAPLCNESDSRQTIVATAALITIDGDRRDSAIAAGSIPIEVDPGCAEGDALFRRYRSGTLPPGRYSLEGVDTVTNGERAQQEFWTTEPFEIVE